MSKNIKKPKDKIILPELFYRLSSIKRVQCVLAQRSSYGDKETGRTYTFKFKGLKKWIFVCEFDKDGNHLSGWVKKGTKSFNFWSNFVDLDLILEEDMPKETMDDILFNMNDLRRKKHY